jgi:hypothetical protein
MLMRVDKIHPALKHAAFSAATLLPGEDAAEFDKLHQRLIEEFTPDGALEEDIVADMARLTWRKQNFATFRIAKLAMDRYEELCREKAPPTDSFLDSDEDLAEQKARQEAYRAADDQARQELGESYKLTDIGNAARVKGLMKELEVKERLDALISKCLKRLLMVRGVKSLPRAFSSTSTPPVSSTSKPQVKSESCWINELGMR